jgi:hypothetical protein
MAIVVLSPQWKSISLWADFLDSQSYADENSSWISSIYVTAYLSRHTNEGLSYSTLSHHAELLPQRTVGFSSNPTLEV